VTTDENNLVNYVVRMVVPMRREFGRRVDVQAFLHDVEYAREVLQEALQSQDARLREYAVYVEKLLHGPRTAPVLPKPHAPAAPAAPAPAASTAAPPTVPGAPAAPAAGSEEAELRARIMKKYTSGLR
jgi:hypothetical protein